MYIVKTNKESNNKVLNLKKNIKKTSQDLFEANLKQRTQAI